MSEPQVLCEVKDAVALATLNRPERMNAWTWQMARELAEFFAACDRDDSVRAIVVTGAGRAFCAGADLERGGDTFAPGDQAAERARAEVRRTPLHPWEVRKPILAALNGAAVGVGLTMPLQYDLRIAARDAKLGFLFVRRGVNPELASTWILPRLVGVARAADLLLSGRTLTGEEAAALGLVNEAVERERVLPRALEIARSIARSAAPVSVAATKRMLWEHLGVSDPRVAERREGKLFAQLGRLADAREGVEAFLEKRDPRWSLRPSTDLPELEPLD
jgi:enoyl-CoA hydratase/carnithine racemase